MSYLWTRGIYMQFAQQRELLTIQAPFKKRPRAAARPLMNADDGSPIQSATSHQPSQQRTAPPMAPPDTSNARRQSVENGSGAYPPTTLDWWYDEITDIPALGQLYEGSERGRSRDVGAVNVGAGNAPGGGNLPNFCCTHERTMNEESCAVF
ncbi:hypothetical protein TcBrA4_0047890 [Trypanosoma cruzi]|nr:hypothetical protein TcBrA4_0047890 [Trypanosoma cruzi]